MTECASRASQDHNHFPYNQHLAMAHYSNGNGLSYHYPNGQIEYQTINTQCSPYSPIYGNHHGIPPGSSFYIPASSGSPHQYSFTSARMPPTLYSQSRAYPPSSHYVTSSSHGAAQRQPRLTSREYGLIDTTEPQDSVNQDTMHSEPMVPPLDGYPDVHEFDALMKRYVDDLSPKKQDKALIHARRAANIKYVLIDKKTTSIESAQFRFWVKKMFSLEPKDGKTPDYQKKICHEGKPVAVREKLFKILTKAHKQCQHGGRDKTSAQVRKVYSWVPKELISRFVKLCPTCQVRRGANGTQGEATKTEDDKADAQSPDRYADMPSRKNSAATHVNAPASFPLQTSGFKTTSTFQQQNRWMTPLSSQKESTRETGNNTQGNIARHDSYNTMPPMPMGCTNGNQTGLSFSPIDAYGNGHGASSAYNSSLSSTGAGRVPTGSAYDVKVGAHFV